MIPIDIEHVFLFDLNLDVSLIFCVMIDVDKIRQNFPILDTIGPYFDNASTTQKPQQMIDAVLNYYTKYNSNVHRSNYEIASIATEKYEHTRQTAARFLNAESVEEIIFTSGTTASINLVTNILTNKLNPNGLGSGFPVCDISFEDGDEVIISEAEHHANFVPWKMISDRFNIVLKLIPVKKDGTLNLSFLKQLMNPRVKMVAVSHVSNVLGIVNPISEIVDIAHKAGSLVLVDGAQAVPHFPVDVQDSGVDFYCFSGHKVFGPTGTGVLYAKKSILKFSPPYYGGGDMIKGVDVKNIVYNDLPYKFEAGTQNIAGFIGLGSSLEYLLNLRGDASRAESPDEIQIYEKNLLNYLLDSLNSIKNLYILGSQTIDRVPLVSIHIHKVHPDDLAHFLANKGISVRSGYMCTHPLIHRYRLDNGVLRISLSFYNTKKEIDYLIDNITKGVKILLD